MLTPNFENTTNDFTSWLLDSASAREELEDIEQSAKNAHYNLDESED